MMLRTCWSIVLLSVTAIAHPAPGAIHEELPGSPAVVVETVSLAGETPTELRRQSFDIVWKTVKEKHFDPKFGGVDWDGVREKYLPRLAGIKTESEFYDLLQQMLGELHESHFGIYPPDAISEEDTHEPRLGTVGADLRIIEGLAVITRIQPDSPAAHAGMATGFVIEAVDGTPTQRLIERASKGNATEGMKTIRQTRAVQARLNGDPGTSVEITYSGKAGTRGTARIKRERLTG